MYHPSRPHRLGSPRHLAIAGTVLLVHLGALWALGRASLPRSIAPDDAVVVASEIIPAPPPAPTRRPQAPPAPRPAEPLPVAPALAGSADTPARVSAAPVPRAARSQAMPSPVTRPRTKPRHAPPAKAAEAPSPPPVPAPAAAPSPAQPAAAAKLPATAWPSGQVPVSESADSSAPQTAGLVPPPSPGPAHPPIAPAVVLPSTDAAYLHNPPPEYPAMSRRLREQGRVVLHVTIGTDGRARQARVLQSSGFDRLDQAALRTVLQWRYVPGTRGGVPEAMGFDVPINFVLK